MEIKLNWYMTRKYGNGKNQNEDEKKIRTKKLNMYAMHKILNSSKQKLNFSYSDIKAQ